MAWKGVPQGKKPARRRCAQVGCREFHPCTTHPWGWRKAESSLIPQKDKNEVIRLAGGRCRKCGRLANPGNVDHIIPRFEGGRDEMSNYQYLCVPCHNRKSRAESKRGRAKKNRGKGQL